KKYPRLTEVGAWRKEKDGTTHGGFYTQDDIKEIVAYAASKNITVVPEIDLPGHSTAAIAAYPFLSCHQTQIEVSNHWGIHRDILCPTDSTIQFFKDVLDEVLVLFPSKYIHLGGDEVPKSQWRKSAFVQDLRKKKGLKNYEQVQTYIMHELETYVTFKGRRVIMWGEALRGGVSDSTIIMSWLSKSAGIKAAKQGREVIMAPRFYCYFDYPQSVKDKKHAWWMTYLSAKKVAKFNPKSRLLNAEQNAKIIGAEATLWTEYVLHENHIWKQLLPRLQEFGKTIK
ncbi:MAG TPA: family 20 glycosylhydrolase, partial [Chitinophagales bacterium]